MAKDNKSSWASKAGQNVQGNMSGAINDQFSDGQGDNVNEDVSNQLVNESKQTVDNVKQAPGKIRDTYEKGKDTVHKVKEMPKKAKATVEKARKMPSQIKTTAQNVAKAAKNAGKVAVDTAKAVGNFIRHPIQTLKNGAIQLPSKIANGVKNFGRALNPKKWLQNLNPVARIRRNIKRRIDRLKNTAKAIKKTIQTVQKMIKFAIKAIKAAVKVAIKTVQLAIKLIQLLIQLIIATWPIWLILLVVGIIVGAIWWFLDNDSTMDNKSLNSEKSEYNDSEINSDGNATMTTISGNTKIIEAFYQYFAEKSIWVVYDGLVYNDTKIEHDDVLGDVYTPIQMNTEEFNDKFMDENGEVILKDYQNRESMFYVNPNALFVYDKYLHGEQIRFPEQIVEHVAYDYNPETLKGQDVNETNDKKCLTEYDGSGAYNPNYNKFILKHLTDDETRTLNITSQKYKLVMRDHGEVSDDFRNHKANIGVKEIYVPDGEEETLGVWDYGLGSILHYVKYLIKHENRGIYENFQVWDKTMKLDANGLKYYGEPKTFRDYEEYEADGNHANYDATDIADLEGDDRLVIYTAENAPTEAMKLELADEDSYFVDWVVTAAGDISNSVVYEWRDSGEPFSHPSPFDKTVERFDEVLDWETSTKTVYVLHGDSETVDYIKNFKFPLRTNINDVPQYNTPLTRTISDSCSDSDCKESGHTYSYVYYTRVIKEVYTDMNVTFNADVNGTKWNKQPFYDGSPYAENISGRRYYEDYLTHYQTYVPYSVSGFFNKEEMLRRIQLDVTDPDLEEELSKILERSEMKNGGSNSLAAGSGYTLGSGANGFEQLYNGSAKETIDRIWDGLISWGYNEAQAAAMLGNIYQESTFRPDVVNSIGASGLCQWLGGRKTQLEVFAGSVNNAQWTDLNSQIQFMCMELDTDRYQWATCQWLQQSYLNTFTNSSDPAEIAIAVMQGWERSGESTTSASAQTRSEVAQTAYSLLSGKEIEYPIDTINPSTTGDQYNTGTGDSDGGNIFTSIWNWLKKIGNAVKEGIKTLFGFEDEYYNIMTQKERYYFQYHAVQESDVDYLLQSIYAYTDDVVISKYYGELDDQFFIDRFTDLFSNPIGTNWSAATAKSSSKTELSNYITIRDENYPDGFQTPLDECILANTTSKYGIYVQASDGQNVYAVCDGTITKVGEDTRYGGKFVILDNGVCETICGHLKEVNVSVGQDVHQGDIIATAQADEMFFGVTNEYKAIIDASFILHRLISDGTLGSEIAAYACQFVGEQYVYGGSWNGELPYTPTDCSGFISGVFRHFGIMNGRVNAATLSTMGIAITQDRLMPGDIICYKNSSGSVYHVVMYIGNNEVVHASSSKTGIKISNITYNRNEKICRRFVGQ